MKTLKKVLCGIASAVAVIVIWEIGKCAVDEYLNKDLDDFDDDWDGDDETADDEDESAFVDEETDEETDEED